MSPKQNAPTPKPAAAAPPSDERQPWELRDGEPIIWHNRLMAWLRHPKRSLLAVYNAERQAQHEKARKSAAFKPAQSVPSTWNDIKREYEWDTRARAYDEHRTAREERLWEKRKRRLREEEWKAYQQLLDKARQMLVFPLARTHRETSEDGKTIITTVNPSKWALRDATAFFELASKLGRLASGQETESISVDFRKAARDAGFDPDDPLIEDVLQLIVQKITAHPSGAIAGQGVQGSANAEGASVSPEAGDG